MSTATETPTTTLTAPFRVVDDQGRLLMELTAQEQGATLKLFNRETGAAVVQLGAVPEDGHGFLLIENRDELFAHHLSSSEDGGDLAIYETTQGHEEAALVLSPRRVKLPAQTA